MNNEDTLSLDLLEETPPPDRSIFYELRQGQWEVSVEIDECDDTHKKQ